MSNIAQDVETGHAVLLSAPVSGHWPTFAVFAAKLVKQRPGTAVTMLVVGDFLRKISIALDQYFTSGEVELRKNIRVIQIGGEGLAFEELLPLVFQNFGQYFTPLVSSSDIVCKSGKTYPGIRPPDIVVIDVFFLGIIHMIRAASPTKIPVYGWLSTNIVSLLRFGRKEIGGYGDVAVEAPILAKQLNKSVEEASYDMYYPTKGEVISVPGLPTMYDYEFDPERPPLFVAGPVVQLKNSIYQFLRQCDGALTVSDDVLEPEGIAAFRAWFAETNRNVYALGPLIPKEHEVSVSEVSDFLSRMHNLYGEHSVIYISTGSHFSPQGPGFAKILGVFLDMGMPLVYSSASGAKLPADLVERLSQSDKVFTSSWIPQRTVLAHPATGYFLTHAGQNSYSEAISAAVPLIVYPITADQPMNAAYISLKHKIGYELLEIRTEYALRPAYRGGHPTGILEAIEKEIRDVIAKAFGPDGEEKRRNIRSLRDRRSALWEEGGASKEAFLKFIREHFP